LIDGGDLRVETGEQRVDMAGDWRGARRALSIGEGDPLIDEIAAQQNEGLQAVADRVAGLPAASQTIRQVSSRLPIKTSRVSLALAKVLTLPSRLSQTAMLLLPTSQPMKRVGMVWAGWSGLFWGVVERVIRGYPFGACDCLRACALAQRPVQLIKRARERIDDLDDDGR